MNIDNEWQQFLDSMDETSAPAVSEEDESAIETTTFARKECEDLYISTQTKIFFLNQSNINVFDIFWNMDIVPYASPTCGVIKKQMRIVFKDKEEFNAYQEKLKKVPY